MSNDCWVPTVSDDERMCLSSDKNVVYEFHEYSPLEYTLCHYKVSDKITELDKENKLCPASFLTKEYLYDKFSVYDKLSKKYNVPINLGEFVCTDDQFDDYETAAQFTKNVFSVIHELNLNYSYYSFQETGCELFCDRAGSTPTCLDEVRYNLLKDIMLP